MTQLSFNSWQEVPHSLTKTDFWTSPQKYLPAPKSVKIKEQAGCGDEQQQSEKLA
jgi:hypothetical protein